MKLRLTFTCSLLACLSLAGCENLPHLPQASDFAVWSQKIQSGSIFSSHTNSAQVSKAGATGLPKKQPQDNSQPIRLTNNGKTQNNTAPGPTAGKLLDPFASRLIYETSSFIQTATGPLPVYYEYFMERPVRVEYQGQTPPAAFMVQRVNDGKQAQEKRILMVITEGECSVSTLSGKIQELDVATYEPIGEALPWALNRILPPVRKFYDRSVWTQNVLATEICSDYSPQFLEQRLISDKLKAQEINPNGYTEAPPATIQ